MIPKIKLIAIKNALQETFGVVNLRISGNSAMGSHKIALGQATVEEIANETKNRMGYSYKICYNKQKYKW
ncbi:hypothetical protein DIC82_14775 [Clostridium beijerinckii]|nr:hypothetical protein DIC82_14775 [Clostridium beijerinckii]